MKSILIIATLTIVVFTAIVQAAETSTLDSSKKIELPGGVSIEMVKVESGTFEMSAKDGENYDDEVPHRATLTRDYYIGKTEVTQAQWRAVMESNPSKFKRDDLPVENVSWNDAMEFCEKLNSTGKAPNGWKFTLPTETQWEYAARGGNKSKGYKFSGSNKADEVAWYYENSGDSRLSDSSFDVIELTGNHCKTHPVGQKKANELGLYDMSGNVYEWCLDDWDDGSNRQKAEFTRGNDQGGSKRAIRGGCWSIIARVCRSAYRTGDDPGFRYKNLGLRLALVQIDRNKTEAERTTTTVIPKESTEGTAKRIELPGGVSLEIVKVEAGTFEMSAKNGENYDDEVPHRATLKRDFFLARTEVTQAQWRAVMGNNPSKYKGDNLPVETVSWNEAIEFCEKLNAMGKAPNGWKYTLPTETQWEYACRGGNKNKGYKYSGSNTINEVAWYYGNSGDSRLDDSSWNNDKLISNHCKTHPVGKKKANELDLYDMSGNVWEWCLDDWQDDSSRLTAEFERVNNSGGSKRAIRGGSWSDDAVRSRSSNRGSYSALGYRAAFLGFRPALVQIDINKTEAERITSQSTAGSGKLKLIHEQVMTINNNVQTGNYSAATPAGQAEIVSNLLSARNRIQQLLDSKDVPGDYRKAVLDMMDTQVNTWRSIQNITSSPGYSNASLGNRMDLVVVFMKQNMDAYDKMNKVLRKYGLTEIDDTTGLF